MSKINIQDFLQVFQGNGIGKMDEFVVNKRGHPSRISGVSGGGGSRKPPRECGHLLLFFNQIIFFILATGGGGLKISIFDGRSLWMAPSWTWTS